MLQQSGGAALEQGLSIFLLRLRAPANLAPDDAFPKAYGITDHGPARRERQCVKHLQRLFIRIAISLREGRRRNPTLGAGFEPCGFQGIGAAIHGNQA